MTKENQDFELYAGESKNLIINVKNVETQGNLIPSEVSKITWYLAPSLNHDYIIKKEIGEGITLGEEEDAELCIVKIDSIDTSNLGGIYTHYLVVEDFSQNVSVALTGKVRILKRKNI